MYLDSLIGDGTSLSAKHSDNYLLLDHDVLTTGFCHQHMDLSVVILLLDSWNNNDLLSPFYFHFYGSKKIKMQGRYISM